MASSASDTRILRLKWRLAFDWWERKLGRWVDTVKAGFDPNQPRVPAGNSNGGQWSGGGGAVDTADANRGSFGKPRPQVAQASGRGKRPKPGPKLYPPKKKRKSPIRKLTVPMPAKPTRRDGPLEPPPSIPPEKPSSERKGTKTAKRIGRWLQKARNHRARGRIGVILHVIGHAGGWLLEHLPEMQSYFDEPKPLRYLQNAVLDPLEGYEVHHIIPKKIPGLPDDDKLRLDTAENLVRIPTWKHHEITLWFRMVNDDYELHGNKVSPQEFLKDKDWETRMQIGLDALRKYGVLKDEDE